MKRSSYLFLVVLALTAMLISACGGSSAISAPDTSAFGGGSSKPQALPVEFTGVIESINGNEWMVNGQTITVDPAVVRDGPFTVGDTVKVEVNVQADGSTVVSRVEAPGTDVNSNDINSNDVNSNDINSNDVNSNDVNSNDSNSNDDNNGNDSITNDDNSNNNAGGDNSDDDDNGGGSGGGDDSGGGGSDD